MVLSVINGGEAKSELKVFNSVVTANSQLKQLPPRERMTHILSTTEIQAMFPNLTKLAAIGLVLPMSTVDCERGFSALSRIKTDLRNRLSSTILKNLMTVTVEAPPNFHTNKLVISGRVGEIVELFKLFWFHNFFFFLYILQCHNICVHLKKKKRFYQTYMYTSILILSSRQAMSR